MPITATGITNVTTLPRQDAYVRLHAISTDISNIEVTVDQEEVWNLTDGQARELYAEEGLAVPAALTSIIFDHTQRIGEALPMAEGLRYHLGFARQKVDRVLDDSGAPVADIDDEHRAAAAIEWAYRASEDVTVTPLLEYVRFWNAGGLGSEDRDYLTAASLFEYRNWNLALAYTGRFVDNQSGPDRDDFQVQVSAGYAFDFGLGADVGWKLTNQENTETQILGLFLTYTLEF